MKKLLVLAMVLVLSFGLTACGNSDVPASTTNQTAADQATQEQALADADYAQLTALITTLSEHIQMGDQLSAVRKKVINGEAEESVLLETTKQMADHSQALLEVVNRAQWKTAYYNEHVGLLKACVGALAEGERLSYEAGVANDETQLEKIAELLAEYETKLGELLDLMGA